MCECLPFSKKKSPNRPLPKDKKENLYLPLSKIRLEGRAITRNQMPDLWSDLPFPWVKGKARLRIMTAHLGVPFCATSSPHSGGKTPENNMSHNGLMLPVKWKINTMKSFFFNIFIYLFIFGWIGSSLLHAGFSLVAWSGATLRCGAGASRCTGFSCCGARALECRFSSCGMWAQ